ncbi:isoleucine--tRNA ligase [Candidatus Dependentiae bacterium]|nr:isoleucine--tRNA ligase [Candidatus Dependentiae bacterium]
MPICRKDCRMSDAPEKKSFKHTLNLPQTTFSIRANAAIKDPEAIAFWENENVYEKALDHNNGREKFILHWGPPYANGHLHMGHALNAVLKDVVCKFKRMSGFQVDLTYGWDCHGLPIELRVAAEQKIDTSKGTADVLALKKACRASAAQWMQVQHQEFKKLGILADESKRYSTMDPSYEADIVRAFGVLVEKGFIERKGKTVPWCASCQTVLASAEIEYKDRKDPSIYVRFVVDVASAQLAEKIKETKVSAVAFAVWTTTPWTLPLNEGVVLHPDAEYALVSHNGQGYLMGLAVAEQLIQKFEWSQAQIVATMHSSELVGTRVQNPLVASYTVPVILDEAVSLRDGTACLHSAPGCGPEDYVIGVKNKLPITSPLSADGTYTDQVRVAEFVGLKVSDVQGRVIALLQELGTLIKKESISHSYPHCWRCRNGLMFRATDQWFCNLEKNDLAARTIASTEQMQFVPDWGRNRFIGSVGTRTEWCISRQRHWGVPIIALVCSGCSAGFTSQTFIEKVAQKIAEQGTEFWDRVTIAELVRDFSVPVGASCDRCGNTTFEKEHDTLDVWFDSGVSHYAFLEKRGLLPADVYLEGSDQHRGWFQSSMLTSMILHDKPCMKTIVTHGYVVDGQGRKMSKSLGNGVEPDEVVKAYGTDVLRLWAAASDFQNDIAISKEVLETLAEAYRKVRNTARFLLANCYDFSIEKDALSYDDMLMIDKYLLARFYELSESVKNSYTDYSFTMVFKEISNFCVNDLSGFYLEAIKDRLYNDPAASSQRRSAQTVLWHILDGMTKLLAPILSFTAEDIYREYQPGMGSVQFSQFPVLPVEFKKAGEHAELWEGLMQMRKEVLKSIERLRESGLVKVGLEVKLAFAVEPVDAQALKQQSFIDIILKSEPYFFCEWLNVSQVEWVKDAQSCEATGLPWLFVSAQKAEGVKCPRCWKYEMTAHPDELCARCEKIV